MKQILFALKETLLSYSPARSQIEGLMKYDFKLDEPRTNLMQLCFSNLASWPLLIILGLIYFDPFKYSWSLVNLFSFDNSFVLFLLDGRLVPMLVFFFASFFLEWIFRKEYILLGIGFYFLNRSELHINLAVVSALGIYFSRICYLWWLSVDIESQTRHIWKAVSQLQALAWLVVAVVSLNALDYMQINLLFNEASEFKRYHFLAIVILLYHIFSHLFLTLWGHFYFQRKKEPSDLPVYYSSANWILRFNMSHYLQRRLKAQVGLQLPAHAESEKQFAELRVINPAMGRLKAGEVIPKEIAFLKEANLRLTKI